MPDAPGQMMSVLRRIGVHAGASALYSGLGALRKTYTCLKGTGQRSKGGWPFAVLLYHRVNDAVDPFFPALRVKAFAAQMKHLAENFNVVPLPRIVKDVESGKGVEPRTVAITFDDGYRDNYHFARPVLKQLRLPASVFIATGFTGTSRRMWNDCIAGAIKGTSRRAVTVELPGENLHLNLESGPSRLASLGIVLERLKKLPEDQKVAVADNLVRQLGGDLSGSERLMLDWSELREMANSGWSVGSHTVEHKILTRISMSEVEAELNASKKILEEQLQAPVTLLAYPNGKEHDFSAGVEAAVRSAGYRAACTTVSRLNDEAFSRFAIRRISPWEEHVATFAVKLEWMFWKSQQQPAQTREP